MQFFWGLFFSMIPTFFEIISSITICILLYDVTLGLVLVGVVLTCVGFNGMGMYVIQRKQSIYNKARSEASSDFVESLLNYETIKYFNNQHHNNARYDDLLQAQKIKGIDLYFYEMIIQTSQIIIIGTLFTYCTYKTAFQVINHTLTLGDFILINNYLLQLLMPLKGFSFTVSHLNKGVADIKETLTFLKLKPEITDTETAFTLIGDKAAVEFKDVSFWYDDRPILKNISFTIPNGKTVVIVGPTGSGKSTITKLLFRLYDVTQGAIFFNNYDIRQVTQESLQKAMSVVSQDTTLY